MEPLDLAPFLILFLLLALRIPIGFSLLSAGILISTISGQANFLNTIRFIVDAPRHYTLIAIPFFVLTAELLISSGLIRLLFDGGRAWFSRVPGGLGNATVLGTVIFAGLSGSSAADVAAFSRIGVEGMQRDGFRRPFSGSLVASAGTLAIMIPPSIAMIIYGSLTDTSIGALMFAGLIPGLILGFLHMVYVAFVAHREGLSGGQPAASWGERWHHLVRLSPIFGLMVVILGGFYTGQMTATEISSISVLYTFLVATLYYRTLKLGDLPDVLVKTIATSASIFFILMGGTLFAKALTENGFVTRLASTIQGVDLAPWQFLIGVSLFLYFLGMFLEGISLNVMTTPLLAPIAFSLGIDPVHYGVFLIFNIEVALISPPVGLHLFITASATGIQVEELYRSIWPFVAILSSALAFLIFFPQFALWLPSLIYAH